MEHVMDPADRLPAPKVRDWAEDKYLHVEHYARMFARAMKNKWACCAYLELFAGAGRAQIEGTDRFVDTPSLRAVNMVPAFDVLAFGEIDAELLRALGERCRIRGALGRCAPVQGDVNQTWPTLAQHVVDGAHGGSHLVFCFIDPFSCSDLAFDTLRGLSALHIDFLVLIPSWMDAHRNVGLYTGPTNSVLDRFLGDSRWRAEWGDRSGRREEFGDFVADFFGLQMRSLGYLYDGLADMKFFRSTERNLPLYHLAFFSRHELGLKLWREAIKSSDLQRGLF